MDDILIASTDTRGNANLRPAWMESAVDQLLNRVREKGIWDIVDFSISIWAKKYPVESRKFYESQKRHKLNRRNKFASDTQNNLRELVNLPWEVGYLLEKIAEHRIEEYGKKRFWREFAKRYPEFSSAQTI